MVELCCDVDVCCEVGSCRWNGGVSQRLPDMYNNHENREWVSRVSDHNIH
jgi:hypothetical protein